MRRKDEAAGCFNLLRALGLALLAALILAGAAPRAEAAQAPEVAKSKVAEVVLLTDRNALAPGEKFTLALKQTLAPGWHTYWRNPGAIGLATSIDWEAPERVAFGEILWPTPSRHAAGKYVNFGYEGEAILLVEASLPQDWPVGEPLVLAANAVWLVCKESCYQETQRFTLSLPVGATSQTDFAAALDVARARSSLPAETGAPARYRIDGDRLLLEVDSPAFAKPGVEDVYFYPNQELVADSSAPQETVSRDAGPALSIVLKKRKKSKAAAEGAAEKPLFEPPLLGVMTAMDNSGPKPALLAIAVSAAPDESVAPVAVASADRGAGEAATPIEQETGPATAAQETGPAGSGGFGSVAAADLGLGMAPSVGAAALLAFLGGLILNLMPCVFPVLALKAMSLARAAEKGGVDARREGLGHGMAYAAGVMASFLGFAALLLALRSAGVSAGWGFQLQSPIVVALLAYLLVAVGLSFSGVFEISGAFAGVGQSLTEKSGRTGDFFTGVLAAVVAAPCTAPFMGAALGYALTQSAWTALVVFAALGVGFAAPIVALSASPAAARMMPKPGLWMIRFRQVLAFPMFLAAAWLFWVLGNQVGMDALFAALVGAVSLSFAVWVFGAGYPTSRRGRLAAIVAGALALVGSAWALSPSLNAAPGAANAAAALRAKGAEPFDPQRLSALREENRTILVNVTADWCISCKVNEANVLSGSRFREMLKASNAVYVKGDWTTRDEQVTEFLAGFGRVGVPLYVVYRAGAEPVVLPQILTESAIEEALGLN